jgi:uncharacterized protein (TIGR03437 family)
VINPFEELAQNGVRREAVPGRSCGARRTLCALGVIALLFLAAGSLLGQPVVTVTTTSLPNGVVGQPYLTPQQTTVQLTAAGGCGCPYQWDYIFNSDYLDNLSYNQDGTITGIPATATTIQISVRAYDVEDEVYSNYVPLSITITAAVPTITTTSLPNGTVGQPYLTLQQTTVQLMATGGSGSYLWGFSDFSDETYDNLTFNSNGTITGVPTRAETLTFQVHAIDVETEQSSNNIGLSITISAPAPPPSPPACVPTLGPPSPLPAGDVNVEYKVLLLASGCPGTTFTFSALPVNRLNPTILPPGLSITNGVLSGTPSQAGAYDFYITATGPNQNSVPVESQYAFTINPLPTITTPSPLPSGPVGGLYSQQITATGGVPGATGYIFSMNDNPPGLSISPTGLLSGTSTQTGTLSFNIGVEDSLGGESTSPFQVTFNNGTALVQVSPLSLTFNADFGGHPPPTQAISVVPATGATPPVTFKVLIDNGQSKTSAPAWISVSLTGGPAPSGLVVSVNQGTLAAGTYPARIRVLDSNNLPTDVLVTLHVNNTAQQLTVSPSILRFGARAAAPGNLVENLLVSNAGAGTVAFTASVAGGSSWISAITPSSGQTTLGQTSLAAPVLLQVQVNTSGLPVGSYHDTIHMASPAGNVDIPISLFVAESGPLMAVNLTGVLFQARQNGGSSVADNIEILDTGGSTSTVNWTASLLSGSDWLNLVSSSGSATPGAPGVLSLALLQSATQMNPGPYYALVQIADSNSLNSPQFVTVVLNVEPDSVPPSPDVIPAGRLFTATVGGSAPAAQQVVINTSSASAVPFQVATTTTGQGSWLSATPLSGDASGQTPASLSISVDPTGLAAGIYTGNVSVSISNVLQSVNVTFLVLPASASNADARPRAELLGPGPEVAGCTPSKLAITETGLANNFTVPAGWPATLIVQLNDDCGSPVLNGNVIASFSNGDPALALVGDSLGNYSATWAPGDLTSEMIVTLNATAGNLQPATATLYGGIAKNQTPPPTLAPGGTLNNLNPVVGAALAPGTLVQVYGTGLAASSVSTGILPLPTLFNDTFAQIGAYQAPLYYLSSGQLNIQLPNPLPATQQIPILLSVNNALTLPTTLDIVRTAPGVLSYFDGPTPPSLQNNAHIVAQHSNFTLVTSANPANPGEYLVMYLVGLGATDPSVASGTPSPSSTLAKVTDMPTVTVDALPASVAFAGLTPGFVGLYQINFQVPTGAHSGEVVITVTQNGVAANPTLLPISQ